MKQFFITFTLTLFLLSCSDSHESFVNLKHELQKKNYSSVEHIGTETKLKLESILDAGNVDSFIIAGDSQYGDAKADNIIVFENKEDSIFIRVKSINKTQFKILGYYTEKK